MLSKILPHNTATVDRALRVVVGLVLLALVFVGPKTPVGWLGLVLVLTGAIGSCPIYTLFGLSTCPRKA